MNKEVSKINETEFLSDEQMLEIESGAVVIKVQIGGCESGKKG